MWLCEYAGVLTHTHTPIIPKTFQENSAIERNRARREKLFCAPAVTCEAVPACLNATQGYSPAPSHTQKQQPGGHPF